MNYSKAGYCMALSVFLSAGIILFTPFFGKCNVTVSLICAFITSLVWTALISLVSKLDIQKNQRVLTKASSLICCALAVFSVLLFMTQAVEVTCFIVGKGVSKQYYLLFSLGLLFAAMYLCQGGKNGIFRFCMTGIIPLSALALFLILPFFTTSGIVADFNFFSHWESASVLCGIKGGIILSGDISLFLLCFGGTAKKQKKLLFLNLASLTFAFLYASFCVICVYILFGTNLTQSLTHPFFAQTKAFGSFDTTEALSGAAIFAFVAKSAIYVRCAAKVIKSAFFMQKKTSAKRISAVIFLFVPSFFLPFLLFGSGTEYGKYQFLIYPVTAAMSVIFAIRGIFEKNGDV